MKIKAVCEQTGLTDRTVRYYIEQGLLSPAFHENYLGRKQFDFTGEDVQRLKNIALLRSFDFTIREIQELIEHPEHSGRILLQVRTRKEREIERGQTEIKTLSGLSLSRPYTLDEMATALRMTEFNPALIDEKLPIDYGKVVSDFLMTAFLLFVTWLPVAIAAITLVSDFLSWEYPVLNGVALLFTVIFLLPTWLMVFYPKIRRKLKAKVAHVLQTVLIICCLNSILWVSLFSTITFTESRTQSVRQYFRFDATCHFSTDIWTLEFFPELMKELRAIDPIPQYYYSHTTYKDDLFLERKMVITDEYNAEIQRIRALFNDYVESPKGDHDMFMEDNWGEWHVLALYNGDEPTPIGITGEYNDLISHTSVSLFAYHEEKQTLRYARFDAFDDSDLFAVNVPYYSTVPWVTQPA